MSGIPVVRPGSQSVVPAMRSLSRSLLGMVPPAGWLAMAILASPLLVAAATGRDVLGLLAIGIVGLAGVVVTIVNPRFLLHAYVALIPIEAVLLVGEAATLTRGVGALFFAGYLLRRFVHLHVNAVPRAGWAFLAWAIASATWALDPAAAMVELTTLVQLFAMMVVVADFVAEEPDLARSILRTFAIAATATAVAALVGALATGSLGSERLGAFESQDVAQFATLLVPALLFVVGELLYGRLIVPATGMLVILSAAVVLSGTRSAWIAIVAGAAMLVLPRIGRRGLLPIVILGLAALALFTVDELRGIVVDRLSTAVSSGGAGRIDIWSVGLNIFGAHPAVGVGYGNFPVAFTPEIIRGTEVPGLNINVLDPGAGPHSLVIATLAELGVVGIALLLPFLLATVRRPGPGPSWPVVHATVAALLIQALFLDITNRKHFWLMLGVVLGLAWRATIDRRQAAAEERERHEQVAQRIRNTWGPES